MLRQKIPHVGSERLRDGRSFESSRKGEEIVEIGGDSSLHTLQRPSVNNHIGYGGAWVGKTIQI